jgi:orotidine-5'-phosphate decarboxylase
LAARDQIALAVDLPLAEGLLAWERVAPHIGVAKVGLSLFVEHGPAAVDAFLNRGAKVFLDLKLHDIPNTVELAATRAGALGVSYLTIHASGGAAMVKAAVQGAAAGALKAGFSPPIVLAVTVLTSMSDSALAEVGVKSTAAVQAESLGRLAVSAGAGGLVCSARETARLRSILGPSVVLCTPGIRPRGADLNDQARTETPRTAIESGANLLVIGRPITGAVDMAVAAKAIETEVASALS